MPQPSHHLTQRPGTIPALNKQRFIICGEMSGALDWTKLSVPELCKCSLDPGKESLGWGVGGKCVGGGGMGEEACQGAQISIHL